MESRDLESLLHFYKEITELNYDCGTNTSQARYPPHGQRTIVIEEGVKWERLRAPPIHTPAHNLHPSHRLNDLCSGDHVEIQGRRNKEFPYGWWYGVVGHSDYCDRDSRHCQCHLDDTMILELNQYTLESRWRHATINRKYHHEEGLATIRKIGLASDFVWLDKPLKVLGSISFEDPTNRPAFDVQVINVLLANGGRSPDLSPSESPKSPTVILTLVKKSCLLSFLENVPPS